MRTLSGSSCNDISFISRSRIVAGVCRKPASGAHEAPAIKITAPVKKRADNTTSLKLFTLSMFDVLNALFKRREKATKQAHNMPIEMAPHAAKLALFPATVSASISTCLTQGRCIAESQSAHENGAASGSCRSNSKSSKPQCPHVREQYPNSSPPSPSLSLHCPCCWRLRQQLVEEKALGSRSY